MHNLRLAVAALAPLALAACGGAADQPGNAAAPGAQSPAEAAASIAVKAVFEPGQWESTSAVTAVSMPGAPAEVTRAMVGKTTEFKHCMTEAEANREPGEIFRKGAGDDCQYERFNIADGKIDALMQCKSKDSGAALSTIEMAGSYDRTSYAVTTRMSVAGPGGQTIAMEAKANGRRTGACS
ncbi:MAG: hypothetical protein ABS87_10345 [Sphingomonas sp. SCN 67-18]|uniref:DUF3617 domain-containing protein n=1 Tax=uncultured Sphingomonas sp. TaxID=158754 RepID=UPI00086E73B8|nr:DUF3617 domain-containing protein [Sphingomonas sp. SCN 67-18]ODU20442.1 MAG: hypothetical protein ABS87_10345 [Sphingomonas sp. SCN 67-18]